ncbi:hypothetical protein Tco_0033265 [Tanacetum coccineum]
MKCRISIFLWQRFFMQLKMNVVHSRSSMACAILKIRTEVVKSLLSETKNIRLTAGFTKWFDESSRVRPVQLVWKNIAFTALVSCKGPQENLTSPGCALVPIGNRMLRVGPEDIELVDKRELVKIDQAQCSTIGMA